MVSVEASVVVAASDLAALAPAVAEAWCRVNRQVSAAALQKAQQQEEESPGSSSLRAWVEEGLEEKCISWSGFPTVQCDEVTGV